MNQFQKDIQLNSPTVAREAEPYITIIKAAKMIGIILIVLAGVLNGSW